MTATWDSVKTLAYEAHIKMIACMASRLPADSLLFHCRERRPTAESCQTSVEHALKLNADWWMWVDDDVIPPPDVYFRLREHADPDQRPVVSALGFFREPPYWPSIFRFEAWPGHSAPSVARPMPETEYPENELIRVDGTGLCTTLVHTSVFRKLKSPWFKQEPDKYTPDGYFMNQLALANIPRHCHTGIIVGHLASVVVNDKTYKSWCRANGPTAAREEAVKLFRLPHMDLPDDAVGELIYPEVA